MSKKEIDPLERAKLGDIFGKVVSRKRSSKGYGEFLRKESRDAEARTTLAEAKKVVANIGFSLSKKDGEYRVAPMGATREMAEAQAYFTNDLDDAIKTAQYEASHGESFDVYVDDVLRKENLFRGEAVREVKRWLFAGNHSAYAQGARGSRIDARHVGAGAIKAGIERNAPAFAGTSEEKAARRRDAYKTIFSEPRDRPPVSGHQRGEKERAGYCVGLTASEYAGLAFAADRYEPAQILFDALQPVDEQLDLSMRMVGVGLRNPWRGEEMFCIRESDAWRYAESLEQNENRTGGTIPDELELKLYDQIVSKIV